MFSSKKNDQFFSINPLSKKKQESWNYFPLVHETWCFGYQKQPQILNKKSRRMHLWGGSVISKKLISHFDINVFQRVLSILAKQLFKKFNRKISMNEHLPTEKMQYLNPTNIASLLLEVTQKYRKLTDYRTKSCSFFPLLSVYRDLYFLPPSSTSGFFHVMDRVLRKF